MMGKKSNVLSPEIIGEIIRSSKGKPVKYETKYSEILWRARVMYPKMNPLPCTIKGCRFKKRNGGCGLEVCLLEVDAGYNLTGKCLSFKEGCR